MLPEKLSIRKVINCPIFTYHSFKEFDGKMDFCTTPDKFEKDLITLFDAGYSAISLRRYTQYIKDDTSEVKLVIVAFYFFDNYSPHYYAFVPYQIKYTKGSTHLILKQNVEKKDKPLQSLIGCK